MKYNFDYEYPTIYYSYNELGENDENIVVTMSEQEIIEQYYDYWCGRMRKIGKNPEDYSYKDCIDDFVVGNWAWQVTESDEKS